MKNFKFLSEGVELELMSELIDNDYSLSEFDLLERVNSVAFEYYPTSSPENQLSLDEYLQIRTRVLQIVALAQGLEKADFTVATTASSKQKFDSLLVEESLELFPLSAYEGGSEQVWSFISLVVLPDVVNWRFPNKERNLSYERHLGKKRNVFRRLWIRMYFTEGRKDFVSKLTEDQAVAIFERADISDNPKLARAYVTATLAITELDKDNEIYRDAMKRVTRLLSTRSIDLLDNDELDNCVIEQFRFSMEALGAGKAKR